MPPADPGFSNAPTTVASQAVAAAVRFSSGEPPGVPLAVSSFAHAPTSPAPNAFSDQAKTQVSGMPPEAVPGPQIGYPMMNAELSAQIATGATVFPSDSRGLPPLPVAPHGSHPGPRPGEHGSHPGPRGIDPSLPPGLASPPSPRDGYPQLSPHGRDSAPGHSRGGPGGLEGLNAQRAAELMSPVGQHYPAQVDWSAAAAAPARAVPPWLLGILFVAAIGVALALTIAIAKLVS
jgi:hypothetical protein